MEIIEKNTGEKILLILAKEPFVVHTVTSIAKILNKTRQSIWKSLNKLSNEDLVILKPVGISKTSTVLIVLNWDTHITEKTISLILTKEASKYPRWGDSFEELNEDVKFLILFGSILNNPKEAKDVDVLAIVDKKNFKRVDEKVLKIQTTQIKKIHFIDLTESEFHQELKRPNKSYIDALRKGVVIYGQENFVKFIKEMRK